MEDQVEIDPNSSSNQERTSIAGTQEKDVQKEKENTYLNAFNSVIEITVEKLEQLDELREEEIYPHSQEAYELYEENPNLNLFKKIYKDSRFRELKEDEFKFRKQKILSQKNFDERLVSTTRSTFQRIKVLGRRKTILSTVALAHEIPKTREDTKEEFPNLRSLKTDFPEDFSGENLIQAVAQDQEITFSALKTLESRLRLYEERLEEIELNIADRYADISLGYDNYLQWKDEYQLHEQIASQWRSLKRLFNSKAEEFEETASRNINQAGKALVRKELVEKLESNKELISEQQIQALIREFEEEVVRPKAEEWVAPKEGEQDDDKLEEKTQELMGKYASQDTGHYRAIIELLELQTAAGLVEDYQKNFQAFLKSRGFSPNDIRSVERNFNDLQETPITIGKNFNVNDLEKITTLQGTARLFAELEDKKDAGKIFPIFSKWSVLRDSAVIRDFFPSELLEEVDDKLFALTQEQAILGFQDEQISRLEFFDSPESIKTLILLSLGRRRNRSWENAKPALHHVLQNDQAVARFVKVYEEVPEVQEFVESIRTEDERNRYFTKETKEKGLNFLLAIADNPNEPARLKMLALEALSTYEDSDVSEQVLVRQYEDAGEYEVKLGVLSTLEEKAKKADRSSMQNLLKLYDQEQDTVLKQQLALILESVSYNAQLGIESMYTKEEKKVNYAWFKNQVIEKFTQEIQDDFFAEDPYTNATGILARIRALNHLGVKDEKKVELVVDFFTSAPEPDTRDFKFPRTSEGEKRISEKEAKRRKKLYREYTKELSELIDDITSESAASLIRTMSEEIDHFTDMTRIFQDLLPSLHEFSQEEGLTSEASNAVGRFIWKLALENSKTLPSEIPPGFHETFQSFLTLLYKDHLDLQRNPYDRPYLFSSCFLGHLAAEPEDGLKTINELRALAGEQDLDAEGLIVAYVNRVYTNSQDRKVKSSAIHEIRMTSEAGYDSEGMVNNLVSFYDGEEDAILRRKITEQLIECRKATLKKNSSDQDILETIKAALEEELNNYFTSTEEEAFYSSQSAVEILNHFYETGFDFPSFSRVLIEVFSRLNNKELTKQNPSAAEVVYKKAIDLISVGNLEITKIEDVQKIMAAATEYGESPLESAKVFRSLSQELGNLIRKGEQLTRNLTDPLLIELRKNDQLLTKDLRNNIPEGTFDQFNSAMERYLISLAEDGRLFEFRQQFLSNQALRYIARQSENVEQLIKLPEEVPALFKYLNEGVLRKVRSPVMTYILSNGDIVGRARVLERVFSHKVPFWTQLFAFTESVIGENLAAASTQYPITVIPKVKVPLGKVTLIGEPGQDKEIDILSHHDIVQKPIAEMTVKEKRALSRDGFSQMSDAQVEQMQAIPFSEILGPVKKLIWLDRLRETVEYSRDKELKQKADSRNREYAKKELKVDPGTYIHGAPLLDAGGNLLDYILTSGNLPGEALGEDVDIDSYPFQVDFSIYVGEKKEESKSVITESMSKDYGKGGDLGINGQFWLVYQRNKDSYESGKVHTTGSVDHGLILGGMPATEISALVLRSPEALVSSETRVLDVVKKSILENGFYIPIYNYAGELIFKPEEYNNFVEERNLAIDIEIIDFTQKIGEELGSNPGGIFLIPIEEKGLTRHYVKYAIPEVGEDLWEAEDRLWNEWLADEIYREAGLAVPKTQVVKMRELNTFGHASEWISGAEDETLDRNGNYRSGAALDMWLANWDIKFDRNLKSVNGKVWRLDNGGALLFRARGERKSNFGPDVIEIDTLRSAYPGLTDEDLRIQVRSLQNLFTDKRIDQLVDSTRLSIQDRNTLKEVLKARRDYMAAYFEEGVKVEGVEGIPDKGREIQNLILDFANQRDQIEKEVREFEKLFSEEGYQHNGVLLGRHIEQTVKTLQIFSEFSDLTAEEKNLALIAMLFHDVAKPTGGRNEDVPRDFTHEIPCADIAAGYMKKWGYTFSQISSVIKTILNDGVISDIVRGKVRDESKMYTPQQFAKVIGNKRNLRILRLVNRADVIATVGESGWQEIKDEYDDFFEEAKQYL